MFSRNNDTYNPSLDGLRAVSVLFVIYGHLSMAHFLPVPIRASPLGTAGVIVFFVLSGFLITGQLNREFNTSGTIRYGVFLAKRAFRLVPAMLAVLVATILLASSGKTLIAPGSIIRAVTYTTNFSPPPSIITLDHLWSLSVEEQFYIIWPLVILAVGLSISRRASVFIVFLVPVLRLCSLLLYREHSSFFRQFETAVDPIALGCLLALKCPAKKWAAVLSSDCAVLFSFAAILFCCIASKLYWQAQVLTISLQALAAGIMIFSLGNRHTVASAILSTSPFVWLGKVSYSVYLWQQMFLMAPHPAGPPWLFDFPLNLGWAMACGTCSYYLIEKPIRDWGRTLLAAPQKIGERAVAETAS